MNDRSPISDTCPPLLRLWLDLEAAKGASLTASLDWLNGATNRSYTLSRFGQWRKGLEALPRCVAEALRYAVIREALVRSLGSAPRDQSKLDRLAGMLSDAAVDERI